MRIPYRQGLIAAPTGFIQVSPLDSTYIDIVISPTPVIAAIASGTKDYLISEQRSVFQAWGPFTGTATRYLYWEVNQSTGAISRGATTLAPVASASEPLSPPSGQMWFDSTNSMMKEFNGSRWMQVLRVFAGSLQSGGILVPEVPASQVGLNIHSTAGYIMSDGLGGVFRDSAGQFLTSDTAIVAPDDGSLIKLDGAQLTVQANENIPKFSAVYLIAGRAALASSAPPDNINKAPIGLVTVDAYQNDSVTLTTSGRLITNEQWAWTSLEWGKSVYCDGMGQLTTTKPGAQKSVRIGTVINAQSILTNFDWETEVALSAGGISGVNALAPLTQFGSPDFPSIGISRASELGNGYLHMDDFSRIPALELALPTKANLVHTHVIADTTGLQTELNGKASTVHSHTIVDVTGLQSELDAKALITHAHAIADVTNLQSELDAINLELDAKTDKVVGAVTGNFAALNALGNLTDSGSSSATFALSAHAHLIANVTGLQTELDGKALLVHGHGVSDITGLQTALDSKADASHAHIISDVIGLQTALDGKALTIHAHDIADVTGLQTALDGKSNTGHTHTVAQVIGLQGELDGKALAIHAHAINDVTGLQSALDVKSDVGHTHAIANVVGLQTALDGKALTIHAHDIADVTGLQTALDGKSNTSHVHALGDLSNVVLTSPANQEVLTFNGTNWVNYPASGGPASVPVTYVFIMLGSMVDYTGTLYSNWDNVLRFDQDPATDVYFDTLGGYFMTNNPGLYEIQVDTTMTHQGGPFPDELVSYGVELQGAAGAIVYTGTSYHTSVGGIPPDGHSLHSGGFSISKSFADRFMVGFDTITSTLKPYVISYKYNTPSDQVQFVLTVTFKRLGNFAGM